MRGLMYEEVTLPFRTRSRGSTVALSILFVVLCAATGSTQRRGAPSVERGPGPVVRDRFGRRINERGLTLVDWEGYMANPAILFSIELPPWTAFPARVSLSANGGRLYFRGNPQGNLGVGPDGPRKRLTINSTSPSSTRISIFPDRDTTDELYELAIEYTDAMDRSFSMSLPIQVIDQDIERPLAHRILLNFSEDESGFFDGLQETGILRQAADDWAYFIEDMQLDSVPVGAETTFIWNWPDAFDGGGGHFVTNSDAYAGFLLYVYGIDTSLLRSGGESSFAGGFQSSAGKSLFLKRSGGVEVEVKGNFNTLGWFLTTGDEDWHVSLNLGGEPNDLYSIAHHEIGHAIAFHGLYPGFDAAWSAGEFATPAILQYHGGPVPINPAVEHFTGVVDSASRRGIFGNEYGGGVPARRWLITKLDLLLLEAIGYQLRETSSLVPLSVPHAGSADGQLSVPYADSIPASGGIPFYDWELREGPLPPGLELDRFTGEITGTPEKAGTFPFDVVVRDYSTGPGITLHTSIRIQ